jgi:hypothetical protein
MTKTVSEYLDKQYLLLRTRDSISPDEEVDFIMELKELWISMSNEERDYVRTYKGE